jgi:hypothetical protein
MTKTQKRTALTKQDVRNDFIDRVLTKCGWSTFHIKRTHGESRQSSLERSFSQPSCSSDQIRDQDDHEVIDLPRHRKPVKTTNRIKITREGQWCRKCLTPVVRQSHLTPPESYVGGYYFEWWLFCPKCKTMYFLEDAKHWFSSDVTDPARDKSGSETVGVPSVAYDNPNWKVRSPDILPWE